MARLLTPLVPVMTQQRRLNTSESTELNECAAMCPTCFALSPVFPSVIPRVGVFVIYTP